jgi:hypothetical protein
LRDRGYLVADDVMGSILPAAVDDELGAELLTIASKRWRGAAREIVTAAIEHKVIFGTPLAEYLPETLVAGRLGLVGDAAHVASPMVGAGFASGLEDGNAFIAAVKPIRGYRCGRRAYRRCVFTKSCGWSPTVAESSRAARKPGICCDRSRLAERCHSLSDLTR